MAAAEQLRLAAWRLRLDVLTAEAHKTLQQQGIPHALLKGPTTAHWLYDPPRHYRDVDILIPRSKLRRAIGALTVAGVAKPTLGRYGEGAPHSLAMRGAEGSELDLHVSLPLVPIDRKDPDNAWHVLAPHIEPFALDGISDQVPALDEPARCLVLALHCISSEAVGPPLEDLRRAIDRASASSWDEAKRLSQILGVDDIVDAALDLLAHRDLDGISDLARLKLEHAGSRQLRWAQFRDLPLTARPGWLAREVLPSRDFMRYAGWPADTRRELMASHVNRWRRLATRRPRSR